jgi:hypothetical protein
VLKLSLAILTAFLALAPQAALAWGFEGHEVVATIARNYLTPQVRQRVDQLLAADTDSLTSHDMASEATWADRYRGAGHPETASWHFVDIELDHPDLAAACYGFPTPAGPASTGPKDDCVVDKITEFSAELRGSTTAPDERLLALKYLLHFVGDVHQPLHATDNHDRGGNCVLLALGGPRSTNLHSYWDTTVVQALGDDPNSLAQTLVAQITPAQKAQWEKGDAKAWAMESYGIAKRSVYAIGSKPGCDRDASPLNLPDAYASSAKSVAALQLEKAGVRLAAILDADLAGTK